MHSFRGVTTVGLIVLAIAIAGAACGGGGSSYDSASTPKATVAGVTTPVATTAAAGAGVQAAPTTRTNDPCGYVTVAEVETATGKTVAGDPTRVNDFSCGYHTSDGGVINTGVASPVDASRFEQAQQASIGSGTLEPIDGLGDKAYAIFFGVAVLKGQTSITVEVSPGPQTGGDGAIALARLLLERS